MSTITVMTFVREMAPHYAKPQSVVGVFRQSPEKGKFAKIPNVSDITI